jgi:hypothetical protein
MVRLLPKIAVRSQEQRRATIYRDLIRQEAVRGGQIFGPIPAGHRREFFCLDERTWVWHEEWTDQAGKHHAVTTRYDIRPQGVLKSQGNASYQLVIGDELDNLQRAAHLFRDNLRAGLIAS